MNKAPETTARWVSVFLARFQKPYGFDADAWEAVFREDIGRDWSDEDLCKTLKWMQGPGKLWKTVSTASTLVIAHRCRLKEERTERESPSQADVSGDCPMCNGKGILPYWPDWCENWSAEQYFIRVRRERVPCMCHAGAYRWSSPEFRELISEEIESYKRKAANAVEQFRAWNKACGEALKRRQPPSLPHGIGLSLKSSRRIRGGKPHA
jgi:hypothetical protein